MRTLLLSGSVVMKNMNNDMIEFHDANSPLDSIVLEDKSGIGIDNDISLCDNYENVILKLFKNSKLICI